MRIGVIGAASMGGTLARHLSKLGHHVSIANSRGPGSLTALAAEIGATPVSVVDATAAILKPLLSGAPSPKLTGAESPNAAPNKRPVSGGRCNEFRALAHPDGYTFEAVHKS
jgi:predicted dinucleotide-binding enzyme